MCVIGLIKEEAPATWRGLSFNKLLFLPVKVNPARFAFTVLTFNHIEVSTGWKLIAIATLAFPLVSVISPAVYFLSVTVEDA